LRDIFEKRYQIEHLMFEPVTFESKINFPLRFMVDRNIVGMSWVKVEHGKYHLSKSPISNCQIEAWCSMEDVIPLSTHGEYSKLAPLRILSIDIECSSEGGHFPIPEKDHVIQISNICVEFGADSEPIIQKMFSFKQCADIVGVDVHSFEKEEDMLKQWRQFVIDLDPDIITGYNISMFDLPFLLNRAENLKIREFPYLSRLRRVASKVKHKQTKVKGFMNRDTIDINLEGRIILDMYTYLIREVKLRSYSLNNVSFQYLGEQKEDVHHTLISKLWRQNEYTRRRLAIYCMKDAYLPLKLMDIFLTLINYSEMCRVTSTPLNFILTRGQQIKVSTQLHKKALEKGYIVPNMKKTKDAFDDEEGFEGAFVLTPEVGFHTKPIVTLDFSSLYPSIMIAHNLCYSTLLKPGEEKNLKEGEDYTRTPNGECFVTEKIRKGILPIILEELLAARKAAKKDMNNEQDPFKKKILNGRQLALKISCNSVYGFTGATSGQLPCLQISSSVTAIGRTMIEKTRDLVQEKYSIKNGFPYDSKVIYGDTDSVMIKFGVETLKEALQLGVESSEYVTKHFKKPIKIEFEKVFWPYLLLKKKKYAGVYWTREDKYDKIDTKGLEVVRRDNCELVRIVMEKVLKLLLVDRNTDEAIKYIKGVISDLLQNKIDISLLIISKSLSKRAEEGGSDDEGGEVGDKKANKTGRNKSTTYQAKQAHVELAEKMRKRDPGTAPNIGDRIQYVIIKGEKGTKNYENSEDPIYVLEHDLPIDIDYYLDNQLKKPLLRIFGPILKNAEKELFSGEHTRIKKSGTSAKSNANFGSFLIVKKTCLNCKVVIQSGVVCKHCKDKLRSIYIENRLEMNNKERMYADLWSQCQRCQGSILQEIICQNRDCPIFYRRYKVKKDLNTMKDIMDRFNEKPDW
jgi:DNA polymerase delta subunit 1